MATRKSQKLDSLYHNYRNFFSIVMLALVDADNKLRCIDVGTENPLKKMMIYPTTSWMMMPLPQTLGL